METPAHHPTGHEDERWGLIYCSEISAETILGAYLGVKNSLICYRSRLCKVENRDCWMADPMTKKNIPFDWNVAHSYLEHNGISFHAGLDPISLILSTNWPDKLKSARIYELIMHVDYMSDPANYTIENAEKTVAELDKHGEKKQR
jgi:hypothetical protein